MKKYLLYGPLVFLLIAYLVVGVGGQFDSIRLLFAGDNQHQSVRTSQKSIPLDPRPVWTQSKHISSTVRIDVSPEPVFPIDLSFYRSTIIFTPNQKATNAGVEISFTRYLPRDPPVV